MATMPPGYYSRSAAELEKGYERHLYRANRVVQGAELNETQEAIQDRVRRISDVLFKDGAVIRDAAINIATEGPQAGVAALAAGVIYARGAMRGVAPKEVAIPLVGTVSIGIYLQDSVVTELEDPALKDPAIEARNRGEPGAARLKVVAVWGVAGDGTAGDYYGVYTVLNGVLQSTLPPPQIDAVAMAIAAYDRDSTGGHYISEGFRATQLADDGAGQVFSLEAGNARVNGRQVLISHAQRIAYDPQVALSLKTVVAEQHIATGAPTQRINTFQAPLHAVSQVLVTAQRTVSVQRGGVNGGTDSIDPDGNAVVSIVSASQGAITYAATSDYVKSGNSVSWAPSGAEPATGSTYNVTYRYIKNATAEITGIDATGFTVAGAVASTNVQVTYDWRRPRMDRICLDQAGAVKWVRGTPSDVAPRVPVVPEGLLHLATVSQTWTTVPLTVGTAVVKARSVANDGTRVQSMPQLESLETKVDNLFAVVSEQQLRAEAAITDPTTKRGIFVDPFDNDDKRDQGVVQNAAVVAGALTLPAVGVVILSFNLGDVQTLPLGTPAPIVTQSLKTGCMLVNPYMAFEPLPARCQIRPATDFWTETVNTWTSPLTVRFTTRREVVDRTESLGWLTRVIGVSTDLVVSTATELVSTRTVEAQELRQIRIDFTLTGFGAGELLQTVKFDGISVPFQ